MKKNPDQLSLHFNNDEIEQLRRENRLLKAEVDRLRKEIAMLSGKRISRKPTASKASHESSDSSAKIHFAVSKSSPIEDKIQLFRQYFRGRDDVYAVRSTDRQGKTIYYPKREYKGWQNGKPLWGDFLPLTGEVIEDHLINEKNPVTIGLYPLLLDETCWFLAIDFDKSTWQQDATAFLSTCRNNGIPATLERSSSGNGGHVWIFFDDPIPSRTARLMGTSLLTRTLEQRHQLGLDSYDRMFPNQDTLPREKKLGNLIALPFQRIPGREGNSLFVDEQFQPYPDQWVYLSSLRKMTRSEVELWVREAIHSRLILPIRNPLVESSEESEPWNLETGSPVSKEATEPYPPQVRAVLKDRLYIEKNGLSPAQIHALVRLGSFQNPEFYRAQKMRLPVWGKPRIINCTDDFADHMALPRGCLEEVRAILAQSNAELVLEDLRNSGDPIHYSFQGELREKQREAVNELLKKDTGVLSATTAFGKTVVGIHMIAARKTNTLILVHRAQLMEQWVERLSEFLDIPSSEIGQIGSGKNKRTGMIDVAMLQTINYRGSVKPFVKEYGHIIVDECHHVSAFSFEQVLKTAEAKYILGLTATLNRKDGHHPIVTMQCGPVRYRVSGRAEAERRPFDHFVYIRKTSFAMEEQLPTLPIYEIYNKLIADETRNDLIFDDLLKALDQGRSPLLLTERTAHLTYFEQRLTDFAKNVIVLRGGMGKKQREAVWDRIRSIPPDEERVLLATGRFIGEGFDDARLDTLFLVTPISWKGTLQQYAGRLHRLYDGKRDVQVYDYVDYQVPMLERMFGRRRKGYEAMGYRVVE